MWTSCTRRTSAYGCTRARARSAPRSRAARGKKPSGVRSPVRNSRSAGSTSPGPERRAERVGARGKRTAGIAGHVGRQPRGDERADELRGRNEHLPAQVAHFSDESWSSKWTPAALASIIALISSKAFSGPPKPASASATIGANQSISAPPSIWSARRSALFRRRTSAGALFAGYRLWSGIRLAGEVRVGGDLPARQVDRLQACAHHLNGLAARHRAERRYVLVALQQLQAAPRRAARAWARSRGCREAGTRRQASTDARSLPTACRDRSWIRIRCAKPYVPP